MKIVFTVHTYWPNKDGVQYVTQYLAEGLANYGHEVTVITNVTDHNFVQEEIVNAVNIKRVFLKSLFSIFIFGKNNIIKEINYINGCDIMINCCVQSPINNILLKYINKIKCKKVLYMHGMHSFKINSFEFKNIKYLLWHFFMNCRWFLFYKKNAHKLNQYDHFVDINKSNRTKDFFCRLGISKPFSIIENAVESFDEPILNSSPLEDPYFLCVANFNERKNQMMIIKAFESIQHKTEYKLVLIGQSSKYSNYLKEYLERSKISKDVYILENIDRALTKKYITNAQWAVMSSHFEVFPIFICESIMCNVPFISTNVGCASLIPGGVIVKSLNQLINAMQNAIFDVNLRKSLGEDGKKFAMLNFSQESKVAELNTLILCVIGNAKDE